MGRDTKKGKELREWVDARVRYGCEEREEKVKLFVG
jgi:hypothetical protein